MNQERIWEYSCIECATIRPVGGLGGGFAYLGACVCLVEDGQRSSDHQAQLLEKAQEKVDGVTLEDVCWSAAAGAARVLSAGG